MDIYNASMIQGYMPEPLKQSDVVLSAKIRGAGSTSNFAYVAPCEDHEGLYTVYTLLNQVCHKLDVLRFGLGGPQHSSSRVKAPRRTRSYHSLNQLLLVRSSAASETG